MQLNTDKYQTSTGMWTVECGEDFRVFEQKELVFPYLSQLVQKLTDGRINVIEDMGERSWFSRYIFGMNPRIIQIHFALEWYEDIASLIFFNDAESEYRVKDAEFTIEPSEVIRMKIAHGEPKPHPTEECLSLQRALKAIKEYLKSSERPDWLEYVYVA